MSLVYRFRLAGHVLEGVPDLLRVEYGDCRRLQSRLLRRLVRHACEHVPMYRRLYDRAGVRPEQVRGLEDLDRLPILTRGDLLEAWPRELQADNVPEAEREMVETSGCSGAPVRLYIDRALLERVPQAALYLPRAVGPELKIGLGRKLLSILITDTHTMEGLLREQSDRRPPGLRGKRPYVDALEPPEVHLEALERFRPDYVFTYPSVLRNMALIALERGLRPFQPDVFIATRESLDEGTRGTIARVFRGRVVNSYAATEGMGLIAFECADGRGLHVRAPDVIVETLLRNRPAPPGVPGRVVITQLRNLSCPLIRYDGLGDVAVLGEDGRCSCGSRLPLLRTLEGRIVDSLVLPGGRLVHPYRLTRSLRHVPGIRQFRILQEGPERVRVSIVPENGGWKPEDGGRKPEDGGWKPEDGGWTRLEEGTRGEVLRRLREVLGEGVEVRVEPVAGIPGGTAGAVRSWSRG